MSILIVGEIFSMLPSSNASGAGYWIFEPVYMAKGDEILSFDGTDRGICGWSKGIVCQKKGSMMKIIPWVIWCIEPLKCLHQIER
jgi:hypothetical protein